MISAKIEANNLEEYYLKLCDLQAGAHDESYLLVHEEIRRRVEETGSYTEFGINQGATLAAAMLVNPKTVRAYDIKFGWYNDAAHLFEQYAAKHNIDYKAFETDTLDCTIDKTDVLYIDTLHKYDHLAKELKRHGHKAQHYIIFHDTFAAKGLRKAVDNYVAKHAEWSIVRDCKTNVGFMTIARK